MVISAHPTQEELFQEASAAYFCIFSAVTDDVSRLASQPLPALSVRSQLLHPFSIVLCSVYYASSVGYRRVSCGRICTHGYGLAPNRRERKQDARRTCNREQPACRCRACSPIVLLCCCFPKLITSHLKFVAKLALTSFAQISIFSILSFCLVLFFPLSISFKSVIPRLLAFFLFALISSSSDLLQVQNYVLFVFLSLFLVAMTQGPAGCALSEAGPTRRQQAMLPRDAFLAALPMLYSQAVYA